MDILPGQAEFLECTAEEVLYSGAFRAGKSMILCEKALALSVQYPGNRGAIFRKTRVSLRHTTEWTFFNRIMPPELMKVCKYAKTDSVLRFPNRSEIMWCGLDDPAKWGSLEQIGRASCRERV